MERQMNLAEMTDGRKYHRNDMVKLGCDDCRDCSECCRTVGDTILLEPWDAYTLTKGLAVPLEKLLADGTLALRVVDGLILPYLNVQEQTGCPFLTEAGRCGIHAHRPAMCRLFPLGRLYENNGFSYILQIHECKKQRRVKVKVDKWLGIPNLAKYEEYVLDWHDFTREFQKNFENLSEEQQKSRNMEILRLFYLQPYDCEQDFYVQYRKRKDFCNFNPS